MRRRIVSGERGQTLVLGVLMLVVLVGITSLVIDLGFAWNEKADAQKSADAAALAGIYYLPHDPDLAYAKAAEWAQRNGVAEGDYEITTKSVLTQDPNVPDTVEVVVSGSTKAFFARVFGFTTFDVKTRAVSRVGSASGVRNFIPFAVLSSEIAGLQTGDHVTIKGDAQDQTSGNRRLLDLDPDDCMVTSMNDFRKSVVCGSADAYCALGHEYEGCSSTVPTKTGNNIGPMFDALGVRLDLTSPECDEFHEVFEVNPNGIADYDITDRCNPWAPFSVPDSKRIVILPVIDALPSGSGFVTIVRFSIFFITEIACSDGTKSCGSGHKDLKGIYVASVGNFGGYEGVGAYTEHAPFPVRKLIE